jgi:glycine/D-amino acid oxidase-like deaminating enzyme
VLLDRVGLLLTGDVSDREVHLRPYGGLEHVSGRRHPLAISHDGWLFESTGAAIHAEATVRFLQDGVELVLGDAVSVDRRGVTLSDSGRLEADRVVVCAGPDTYRLVGLPEPARLRSVRFSFALRELLREPAPCWIQRDERLCEPFYAVMDGPDHYSVGLSDAAPAAVPEAEHIREAHRRLLEIATRALPGVRPVAERVIACEFTTNPAGARGALAHDGWDLQEHDGVVTVTGPSLFKFAPLLGRLVAERLETADG